MQREGGTPFDLQGQMPAKDVQYAAKLRGLIEQTPTDMRRQIRELQLKPAWRRCTAQEAVRAAHGFWCDAVDVLYFVLKTGCIILCYDT